MGLSLGVWRVLCISAAVQVASQRAGRPTRLGRRVGPGQAAVWRIAAPSLLAVHRDGHGRGGRLGTPGSRVAKAAPVHHLVKLRQVRLEVHVHGGGRQHGGSLRGRAVGGGHDRLAAGMEGGGPRRACKAHSRHRRWTCHVPHSNRTATLASGMGARAAAEGAGQTAGGGRHAHLQQAALGVGQGGQHQRHVLLRGV